MHPSVRIASSDPKLALGRDTKYFLVMDSESVRQQGFDGRLRRLNLIDAGLRAPRSGAPFAYVTTRKFLKVFGLASLRDLPDIERLEDEGLLQRSQPESDLDGALGLPGGDGADFENTGFGDAEDDIYREPSCRRAAAINPGHAEPSSRG